MECRSRGYNRTVGLNTVGHSSLVLYVPLDLDTRVHFDCREYLWVHTSFRINSINNLIFVMATFFYEVGRCFLFNMLFGRISSCEGLIWWVSWKGEHNQSLNDEHVCFSTCVVIENSAKHVPRILFSSLACKLLLYINFLKIVIVADYCFSRST